MHLLVLLTYVYHDTRFWKRKEKNLFVLPGIKPRFLKWQARSPIAVWTGLPLLLNLNMYHEILILKRKSWRGIRAGKYCKMLNIATFSELWSCEALFICTKFSEKPAAPSSGLMWGLFFRTSTYVSLPHHSESKNNFSSKLHGITFRNVVLFIIIVMTKF